MPVEKNSKLTLITMARVRPPQEKQSNQQRKKAKERNEIKRMMNFILMRKNHF